MSEQELIDWVAHHIVEFTGFDIEDLMLAIGKRGHHVFMRYDPDRKSNMFTVMIGSKELDDMNPGFSRMDTDEPLEALCKLAHAAFF